MTDEQVKMLIAKGEGAFLEFKRYGNGIESDVYESVCSFSNRFGGYILCGVLDDGTINGVGEKALKAMLSNFATVISNPQIFSPVLTRSFTSDGSICWTNFSCRACTQSVCVTRLFAR